MTNDGHESEPGRDPVELAKHDPPEAARQVAEDHPVAGAAGAATGAATGLFLGGPVGALIGAAVGAVRGVLAGELVDQLGKRLHGPPTGAPLGIRPSLDPEPIAAIDPLLVPRPGDEIEAVDERSLLP